MGVTFAPRIFESFDLLPVQGYEDILGPVKRRGVGDCGQRRGLKSGKLTHWLVLECSGKTQYRVLYVALLACWEKLQFERDVEYWQPRHFSPVQTIGIEANGSNLLVGYSE
jgi:hypothetical protein